MVRTFELPTARDFALRGGARLSTDAGDDVLDALLEATPAPSDVRGHVVGPPAGRAHGARGRRRVDGDPTTAWTTPFDGSVGPVDRGVHAAPVTVDHLDLAVVADGRHSVPTRLRIEADGESRVVDVPAITDSTTVGATTEVPLDFEPVTGSTVRVTVDAIRPVSTLEFYSESEHRPAGRHRRARHPGRAGARTHRRRHHRLSHRPAHDRRRAAAGHGGRAGGRRPRRATARRADMHPGGT